MIDSAAAPDQASQRHNRVSYESEHNISKCNTHYKPSHTMAQIPHPGPQSGPGRVRSNKS